MRRLNALLAHPKDRLQTLAAEACKAIYSPEFFAELEGVQYLRRYDFAHALATLPQQDGPESLSYRRKVLGPEKVEPDEAEVDTPGLAQAADALNGKVAAITGDGSGAGAPGSKELGTKAPGAQNSGVEATGWAAEEQGTFTVFGTEGGALPFYEDQETVTRMPEAMQRQAVAAFKAKAPAGYALAAPYLAVPFDFNLRGRRHFAAFMSMWDALRVEPGELGAHAAYYYADGLYHMGYYGRARFLSTWSKSWYYERRAYKDSQPEIRSYLGAPEDMEYHQALLAEKIFAQIPGRTTNRDLAACALFAAAQCLQTRSTTYECNSLDKDVPTGSFFTANPYFQALTTRYVDTAYSYAVYQTCSHLEDFVRLQHDPKRVPPSPYPEDKE